MDNSRYVKLRYLWTMYESSEKSLKLRMRGARIYFFCKKQGVLSSDIRFG